VSAPALRVDDDERIKRSTPYLSFSRLNRYLHCPEQYKLYYVEGLRPRVPAANLVFGQMIHEALAELFRSGVDPVATFTESWNATRDVPLTYSTRDSWDRLLTVGTALLERFVAEALPKLSAIEAIEAPFQLDVTNLDLPLVGVIDLVAALDGRRTVIDFKTSASAYGAHEVALSDQLTAYQLAEPAAEAAALCVLVKTKDPKIEWHLTHRTGPQFTAFLSKARLVGEQIAAGAFYTRPGTWCAWCDFQPVCTGNEQKARETLVRVG
jgi:CRISPR/Cas system-associated exonuclease Cas4 (RecB family)